MAESDGTFFNSLEHQFQDGSTGRKPIPLADFSPIHGLMQYAYELQADLRKFELPQGHVKELGNAATYMLDRRLSTLNPAELRLSFLAIKSFALLDSLPDNKWELFDFDGIHLVNGTPTEFIYGDIYNRPTLSLAFEKSEFLTNVPLAEENPAIPSDFLAIPVYSFRLDDN